MLYVAGGEIMLKIAVLDDEPVFLSEFTAFLHQLTAEHETTNIDSFTDSSAFLQSPEQYDLIFLDIDMPGLSGIDIAALLRTRHVETTLVFVSAFEHFVFETIRYTPFRFIRKSRYRTELPEAVESFLQKRSAPEQTILVTAPSGGALPVSLTETAAFYAVRHDIFLLNVAKESIPVRPRELIMEKLEQQLQPHGFLRPHKSWLVNYRHIHQIYRDEVILDCGEHVPMSRRRTSEIRQQYGILLRDEDML